MLRARVNTMSSIRTSSILLSLSLFAGCANALPPLPEEAAPRSISLASTQWPPFTAETGAPRVANELVDRALRSDSIEVHEAIVPVDAWLPALRAGEYDGSSAMWWSEDRTEYLLFSEPYLENRLVLIGRADSDLSAGSFAELGPKRVGIVAGYAYGESVSLEPTPSGPVFVEQLDTPTNLRALLAEELDYVLADALLAEHSLNTHPEREQLRVGEIALVSRSLHFAVRKDHPDATRIVADFDGRVRQMLRDGTYNKVLGFGWIEADVDGDGVSDFIFAGESAGEQAPEGSYRIRTPEKKKGPEFEAQPDYIINGERYDGWDSVPDSYKVTGVGGTNIGLGINW